MTNLYIDFDGVILDTITVTYEMIQKQNIEDDHEEIRKFYKNLDWELLLKETPIINDAFNCIKKILDTNLFNVSILTHVNSLNEAVHKVNYIRNYFKDITVIPVPKAISKTKMVRTEGAILIDDYAYNLREWESENGIGIRFSTKLNGKGFRVIDKLDQILEMELV